MEVIKNEAESSKILINKLAAAERQLGAAIRMYFMEEDALAIHMVTSAAYGLYADLLRHRGKDPAFHGVMYGLLSTAKSYIAGDLSDKDLEGWGEGVMEALQPTIDMLKEKPDIDIDEVTVSGPAGAAREFYRDKRQAYNFLKHADHDPDAILDSASVNNEDLIFQAIGCSWHLNCPFTPEKELFHSAMVAFGRLGEDHQVGAIAWFLRSLSHEEVMHLGRRNLCYSRVDDDLDIDFEEAREKALNRMNEYFEKKNDTRGESRQRVQEGDE